MYYSFDYVASYLITKTFVNYQSRDRNNDPCRFIISYQTYERNNDTFVDYISLIIIINGLNFRIDKSTIEYTSIAKLIKDTFKMMARQLNYNFYYISNESVKKDLYSEDVFLDLADDFFMRVPKESYDGKPPFLDGLYQAIGVEKNNVVYKDRIQYVDVVKEKIVEKIVETKTPVNISDCAVCQENKVEMMYGCGHACICELCFNAMKNNKCPICRYDNDKPIKIHMLYKND